MRHSLTNATAFDLLLTYARQHRISTRAAEAMAHVEEGLTVPAGKLVYVGARWYFDEIATTSRRFEVNLPRVGSCAGEIDSRARLAINLIEIGYPSVQAHAGDLLVSIKVPGIICNERLKFSLAACVHKALNSLCHQLTFTLMIHPL